MIRLACLTLALFATTAFAAPDVRVEDTDATVVLDNGILAVTLDKEIAQIVSLEYRPDDGEPVQLARPGEGLYLDVNAGPTADQGELEAERPRAGYTRPRHALRSITVTEAGPDVGEVAILAGPSQWMPFEVEYRFRLNRGDSGLYAWARFRHGEEMPAASLEQARFVLKAPLGRELFTHYIVDDSRVTERPISPVVERVQDATDRLEDGTVVTKYDNAAFTSDYLAHGMAGDDIGVWVLYPSTESFNGGPLRQDLTVHEDNILLAMFQSRHYGAGGVELDDGAAWDHVYGPVVFYANSGGGPQRLHADAKVRALAEQAKWPYPWLEDERFALDRGRVVGQVELSTGEVPAAAWAVLWPGQGDDWATAAGGYFFWTTVGRDGSFEIDNVRPGTYTLSLSGGDQPEDLRVEHVVVEPGSTRDLGKVWWTPETFGTKLWQIGRFDRSALEFHDGEPWYYRSYDAFRRYRDRMPEDVRFVIGQSRENPHWYFAQWAWYNRNPTWQIEFDLDERLSGEAQLTLGLASARSAGDFRVTVNDVEIESVKLPKSGAAGYRSGGQDSRYTLLRLPFDASLLREGTNVITLGHTKAVPFPASEAALREAGRPPGEMMYDALKLEVRATGAD